MAFAFNDDKSKADLLELVYPIGAIYMSVNSVNPGTLFGGTWVAWGSGRVPVGVNASDTNFSSVEKTGGAATHTLTAAQLPSHTHTYAKPNANTNTTTINTGSISVTSGSEIGHIEAFSNRVVSAFNSLANLWATNKSAGNVTGSVSTPNGYVSGDAVNAAKPYNTTHSHAIGTTSTASGSTGSGNAHNNLQPYITCYMWKRTA